MELVELPLYEHRYYQNDLSTHHSRMLIALQYSYHHTKRYNYWMDDSEHGRTLGILHMLNL